MFETGVDKLMSVNQSTRSRACNREIFSIVFNMKVYCVFSLESPLQGHFSEYTQYIIFNIKKENHSKLSQICSQAIFSKGLKNKFETAMIKEPSVLEPLKFYCMC